MVVSTSPAANPFDHSENTSEVQIDESRMRFHFLPSPEMEIPFANSSAATLAGTLRFELLEGQENVAAVQETQLRIASGKSTQTIQLNNLSFPSDSPSELGWYRLRYSFTPAQSHAESLYAIVQFGLLFDDPFAMRISGATRAIPGSKYPVRVRVDNPRDGKPYGGVRVSFQLEMSNNDNVATENAITDSEGYALVSFALPKENDNQKASGTVSAVATRGQFSEREQIQFGFPREPNLTLSTDKPLYQPGQTVHLRVLAFGPDDQALAGVKVTVKITNEDEIEQFRVPVTTSTFGIASADWEIPQKLHHGKYNISVELESSDAYDAASTRSQIRITRYELPTFNVTAEPDSTYYLPGQAAKVRVHADYLFGQPVQHAKVKVVREEERQWNFKEQKWTVNETAISEGQLGTDGSYTAIIDLNADFNGFEEFEQQRYKDVRVAAYVTDDSTGRTEQRRLQLRLSRQAIHLYINGPSTLTENEPIKFYVTSSYADGRPASIDGEIEAALPNGNGSFDEAPDRLHRVSLEHFHTNKYGIAKVELSPLATNLVLARTEPRPYYYWSWYYGRPWRGVNEQGETRLEVKVLLRGNDEKGNNGQWHSELSLAKNQGYFHITANRALFHPGDPIHLSLDTDTSLPDAVVNLSNETGLLISHAVSLKKGHAEINIAYDRRFSGPLNISAFAMTSFHDSEHPISATTHALYPAPQELKVGIQMPRNTFRPGETVDLGMRVRTAQGYPIQSALGMLVFDEAVAERVRTDEDFEGNYGFSINDYFDSDYSSEVGGITYRDLLYLDRSNPFPAGLDIAAELILRGRSYWAQTSTLSATTPDYKLASAGHFQSMIEAQLAPVDKVLHDNFIATDEYPHDQSELFATLKRHEIDPESLVDPWGTPYCFIFFPSGTQFAFLIVSSGPDKRPDTNDDFVIKSYYGTYFRRTGQLIDQVAQDYVLQTGQYIRDYSTLLAEMKKKDIDLDELRDPWGNRYIYTFGIQDPYFTINVDSAGPDRALHDNGQTSDDVHEWTSSTHYFQQETTTLSHALDNYFAATGRFPQSLEELEPILKSAGLTGDKILDRWGHSYFFRFSGEKKYTDQITTTVYSVYPNQPRRQTKAIPVTGTLSRIDILSNGGPDHVGPFVVEGFSHLVAIQSSQDSEPLNTHAGPVISGTGQISGTITDPTGAVIRGARIVATSKDGQQYTAVSDDNGRYALTDVPAGSYGVRIMAAGFEESLVMRVPINPPGTTSLDVALRVRAATETVDVRAEVPLLETSSSEVATVVDSRARQTMLLNGRNFTQLLSLSPGVVNQASQEADATPQSANALFTPRLRQYFPETLLWRPEIVTDTHGAAHISFPMADNITTWRMSVVASTRTGEIGIADKELRTFQPFFLEHDPPKVLTQGDRIVLPAVLRNYTSKSQILDTELKPESWFSMLSNPKQSVHVLPNADARAIFAFEANKSIRNGKQRVTARNKEVGDAVEREIMVHPNGQEVSTTVMKILTTEDNSLQFEVPDTAIPGSIDAELRIYPNAFAHVLDAMRGVGMRPTGCGEQITSTGYVNLLALELLKKAGQDAEHGDTTNPRAAIATAARKSLQEAYDQLVDLQKPDGGFPYWRSRFTDTALSAYIVRFLAASAQFIQVDPQVIAKAQHYLTIAQSKNGSWMRHNYWDEKQIEDPNLTAYVARALATSLPVQNAASRKEVDKALDVAMAYLEDQISSWTDPYLVSNYAIAAFAGNRMKHIEQAKTLLADLAHREGSTLYWNLESNTTPFYGWGFTGRIETTALAVEALAAMQAVTPNPATADEIAKGLQFLLSHKDRYACWYSTQATQNVIEAIVAAMPASEQGDFSQDAAVLVNGHQVRAVHLPSVNELSGPIYLELAQYLEAGNNKVELSLSPKTPQLNALLLGTYYIPWKNSQQTAQSAFLPGDSRALRLKVSFDRRELKTNETARCHVEVERIGFRGYGMMIAEVGLPPGADVDRSSLEAIRDKIDSYEVQPDRVLFYIWPQAGGTAFDFQFRLRYGMNAMATQSTLYDYYNPESNATLEPEKFAVDDESTAAQN